MRGVGRASAAATVVNALPTGVGGAIGLDLTARADVELSEAGSGPATVTVSEGSRSNLVDAALRQAIDAYLPGRALRGRLSVDSEIPVARGLKSSSAVASAVILAVARAAGRSPASEEVARLSAEAARSSRVSATGAFDDALAGLTTGFVLTDNREDRVLARGAVSPEWEAAVLVPPERHRPSPEWAPAFVARAEEGARIVAEARAGNWAAAMEKNSELVERVVGYPYAGLRSRLREHGAAAAGVSGLGPALVALAPVERVPELLEVLSELPGDVRRLGLRGESRVRVGGIR